MTDPIADMFTRIRNAAAIKKYEVVLPMSKIKYEIAKILEKEGWVQKVEIVKAVVDEDSRKTSFDTLKIILKYKKSGKSAITSIKRVSRPGLKIYAKNDNLPKVLNDLGIAIISTSSGLMTNRGAEKKGVGGEVICKIY